MGNWYNGKYCTWWRIELTAFGHTGLETDGDGDIRDGRGKVYKQDGTNVAYT